MTKMIPPVPTSAVMMPTPKQKIGFSIESIVGNDAAPSTNSHNINNLDHHLGLHDTSEKIAPIHLQHLHHHQQQQYQTFQQQHSQPPTRHDIQDIINRLHHTANNLINNNNNNNNSNNNNNNLHETYSPPPTLLHVQQHSRLSPEVAGVNLKRERSPAPITPPASRLSPTKQIQPLSPQHSPPNSPQPQHHPHHLQGQLSPASLHHPSQQHQQQSQFNMTKGPIVVPGMPAGLIRPFPVGSNSAPQPDIKALPPYISSPEMVPPQHQHPHPHHNPHLLAAAQFQMAAALQAGHVLGPAAAAAAAAAGLQSHSPFLQGHHGGVPRDSYPLYPWLLSRHGRIFPHRFPGNFLLQPFRKPKRIRTAFSPSQLLKLEHAFESNQYVVGAERKALAQSLNLSETQVKVWFQNRRTKHKRMQQEDEKGPGGHSNGDRNSCDEEDDELIDMEMDDCPSDDELDASH